MDLDVDDQGRISSASATSSVHPSAPLPQKLEFADMPSVDGLADLSGLDISFDASSDENGKIRVRILPASSSTPSSRAGSVVDDVTSSGGWTDERSDLGLENSFTSDPYTTTKFSTSSTSLSSSFPMTSSDPFFGVGTDADFGMGALSYNYGSPMYGPEGDLPGDYSSPDAISALESEYGGSDSLSSTSCAGKRRVRVTLKSMPTASNEGGEWEVQFC